jgi:hypothetical protein
MPGHAIALITQRANQLLEALRHKLTFLTGCQQRAGP